MTFAKTLSQVKQLTAINDHGGALLTAAKALGCDDLVVRLEVIKRQHLHLGHLPQKLYEERHGIYKDLLAVAQRVAQGAALLRLPLERRIIPRSYLMGETWQRKCVKFAEKNLQPCRTGNA